ncbi:hypothetical protein G9A89_008322 [Geosiphon pyriformis]|nr:hypothetical protein G9A89_008322 [Geosiphon pyriformis]
MENKEIKRTLPDAHDCKLCRRCRWNIRLNNDNLCRGCHFIFFEKFYKDFSSGNEVVDEIIKNPIYIPPEGEDEYGKVKYYEWIPWERLSNIHKIARGGFGIIYKATLIDGLINARSIRCNGKYESEGIDRELAIKIIPTNNSEVFKELAIQRVMFTNNNGYLRYISSMYGITQNAETLEYGIVMEFAEHGDMRKYLSTNFHSTSWYDKLYIASDIAEGLDSIHSSGIVHRDLHSGNILQYVKDEVTIGDLGLCQPVNSKGTTIDATTGKATEEKKEIFGVIPYIPPEVLRGEKFTDKGDIYSFAMLLWELATGKPPFHDRSHDLFLVMDILYNGIRPKITSPLIPPSYAEIIVKCWDVNPENRPTAKEVVRKLWENKISEPEFLESDKYVFEMLKNDSTTTAKTTTTTTCIHPGAVYTSRLLTLQIIEETKELVYLPEDEWVKESGEGDDTTTKNL